MGNQLFTCVAWQYYSKAASARHPYYRSVRYLKPKTLYHVECFVTFYLRINVDFFKTNVITHQSVWHF